MKKIVKQKTRAQVRNSATLLRDLCLTDYRK